MANITNTTFQTVIDNAAVGEVIALTNNIEMTKRLTVSNVVTIDLNGYSITGNFDDGYGLIYVGTKGDLTIKDSSIAKTGSVTNLVGNAVGNYGVVNIYGGIFTGNYALYNFFHSNSVYGTSIIHGGTFKSVTDGFPSIANCGDLTINGGTVELLDTTSTLVVNGGDIKTLYVGETDYITENQTTSITGGNITEFSVNENSSNDISISGGTFKSEIDEEYLADGFELTYNEGTGTYGAIDNSEASSNRGLKVIATSSSRIKDLIIRNNQLIFIQDLKRIAFDFNNKRVFYNQIVELDTDAERLALDSPLSGYYFVIDKATLWYYRDGWTQITQEPEEVVFIGVELPELGSAKEGTLYVNKAEREISVFDSESNKYIVVSDYTKDVTDEDINSLFG